MVMSGCVKRWFYLRTLGGIYRMDENANPKFKFDRSKRGGGCGFMWQGQHERERKTQTYHEGMRGEERTAVVTGREN